MGEAERMAKAQHERDVNRFESCLIMALYLLAQSTVRLTKQLNSGRCSSEIAGAAADLRKISNDIERANADMARDDAGYKTAVREFTSRSVAEANS